MADTEGIIPPGSNGWTVLEQMAADGAVDRSMYQELFHGVGKQMLYNVFLLFAGRAETQDGRTLHLPWRLSSAELDRAREHFAELWQILRAQQLERSPLTKARADRSFQAFLHEVARPRKKRRRRRGA